MGEGLNRWAVSFYLKTIPTLEPSRERVRRRVEGELTISADDDLEGDMP